MVLRVFSVAPRGVQPAANGSLNESPRMAYAFKSSATRGSRGNERAMLLEFFTNNYLRVTSGNYTKIN